MFEKWEFTSLTKVMMPLLMLLIPEEKSTSSSAGVECGL
jgi:hypothetical protein